MSYAEEARQLGISRQAVWAKRNKCNCRYKWSLQLLKFGWKKEEISHHRTCVKRIEFNPGEN